tara:strand:+ start:19203 stop:20135 length:933 start_codon:yes stop_codon:yes gene_type:complete
MYFTTPSWSPLNAVSEVRVTTSNPADYQKIWASSVGTPVVDGDEVYITNPVGPVTEFGRNGSDYHDGELSNHKATSTSPMQNVNVIAGNGTDRFASIPTFAPIAFTSKQWIRIDDLSTVPRIWGNDSSGNTSRLAINTAGRVILTDSSGNTLGTSSGDIVEGKDHYLETEVLADGSCEIWVDGVSQASASAGAFDGLAWDIDSIHRSGGSYSSGITVNQVFQDLAESLPRTYNNTDNYVSGGSVILPDSTGGADGTWVNAVIGDLQYLPVTNRYYRIDEGEGATIYDIAGSTPQNGTIQNENDSNWNLTN